MNDEHLRVFEKLFEMLRSEFAFVFAFAFRFKKYTLNSDAVQNSIKKKKYPALTHQIMLMFQQD